MRPRPFSGLNLVSTLVFAAGLLAAAMIFQTGATAQDAGAAPPLPPPPPVAFQNPIPGDQLTVLSDFAGKPAKALMKDKRFHNLMKIVVPRTTYHYGSDMSLSEAIETVLDGSSLAVEIGGGRYVMVSGYSGPYLRGRGFLWFDMQQGIAVGGFYFQPTNGEPTPTFTVFSRQLQVDSLSMSQLPLAFAQDASQWALLASIPAITPRYFIPENGKKYVLVHDEDYCDHPPNAPAPAQSVCEQMNANAADADMNAAYFMHETHNAANATAWMLGPDQVAWLGMRTRTCGALLACSIRVTRERTRVLMGGPPSGGPHRR